MDDKEGEACIRSLNNPNYNQSAGQLLLLLFLLPPDTIANRFSHRASQQRRVDEQLSDRGRRRTTKEDALNKELF